MCIGVPMRVTRIEGASAWCEGRGETRRLDMTLIGPQPLGSWVLAFLDAARAALTETEARQVNDALDALEVALRGEPADLDAYFPDLARREPELPPHLRTQETAHE
jgi:hydrogenase expression/formation protein HypC